MEVVGTLSDGIGPTSSSVMHSPANEAGDERCRSSEASENSRNASAYKGRRKSRPGENSPVVTHPEESNNANANGRERETSIRHRRALPIQAGTRTEVGTVN